MCKQVFSSPAALLLLSARSLAFGYEADSPDLSTHSIVHFSTGVVCSNAVARTYACHGRQIKLRTGYMKTAWRKYSNIYGKEAETARTSITSFQSRSIRGKDDALHSGTEHSH